MQNTKIRNLFILVGSTLSVLQGAMVAPALPKISEHFAGVENIEFLSKMIIAISPLFLALFSPIAGTLLEKYGRKRVLIIASILYAFAGTTGFYLDNIYLILVGRALLGITISALMSGFIVVLGDLYKGDELNKYIGIQGALMSFCGMLYLIIGGFLAEISWNLPFISYLFSLIIAVGLLFFFDETKPNNSSEFNNKPSKIDLNQNIIILNLIAFCVMAIYLMIPTQLPFLLDKLFSLSNKEIGVYLALWIFSSSIGSFYYARIRKLLSIKQIYMFGFLIWSIGYLILFTGNSIIMIQIGLFFSGLGNGFVIPNLKIELLENVSELQRGKQSGLFTASLYFGQFFSPILIQPIIKSFNIQFPFLIISILLILLTLLYFFMNKKVVNNK